MKRCSYCRRSKPAKLFNLNNTKKDGLQSYCKSCSSKVNKINHNPEAKRRSDLKRRYKLDWKRYLKMYKSQCGKCYICETNVELYGVKAAHIDHDHSDSSIRGLLCRDCNLGLGYFKDNISLLFNAIKYLKTRS